jgi:hypothetical protein
MSTPTEMRDLARRLLAYEADAGKTLEPAESTTLRVYEKLRRCIGEFAGSAGFQSLANRALMLARLEVPSLSAVHVAADGILQGISEIEPPTNIEREGVCDGGVILISQLLALLLTFLGQALTMNLVREVWPDAVLDDRDSTTGEIREHTR